MGSVLVIVLHVEGGTWLLGVVFVYGGWGLVALVFSVASYPRQCENMVMLSPPSPVSVELRELESKLRAAYTTKERVAQMAEKEAIREKDKARECNFVLRYAVWGKLYQVFPCVSTVG